jgi:hypothetical protein
LTRRGRPPIGSACWSEGATVEYRRELLSVRLAIFRVGAGWSEARKRGWVSPACPAEVQSRPGPSVAGNNASTLKQEPHMNRIFVRRSGVTAPWCLRRGRIGVWYRAEVALTSVRLLGSLVSEIDLVAGLGRSRDRRFLESVPPTLSGFVTGGTLENTTKEGRNRGVSTRNHSCRPRLDGVVAAQTPFHVGVSRADHQETQQASCLTCTMPHSAVFEFFDLKRCCTSNQQSSSWLSCALTTRRRD